jgi:glucose/arabinose dehydrogenase
MRALLFAVALQVAACGGGSGGSGGAPPPAAPTLRGAEPTPTPPGAEPTATPQTQPPPPSPEPTGDPDGLPPLRLTEVASGLDRPLFVAQAPGDDDRLFVVEQTGAIRIVEGGRLFDEPFLDLAGSISCCMERGLLGLAFHPDYAENGRFFVDYTNRDGDTEIVELARSAGDPRRAEPDPVRLLLRIEQPFANHNGGMLAFAPDGTLIVAMGDGGGAGDPQDRARDLSSKLGKLLRIDVDRHPEPPPGNHPGADPDVWHIGLRNPWRFSFDRATGDLWIGDVGQNAYEEIDFAPAGSPPLDFGWPATEGLHCFRPTQGCDTRGIALPVHEYGRDGGCSVTGGYVYRGTAVPGLAGWYLFGDFCSSRVWARSPSGAVVELTPGIDPEGRIGGLSSFGEDALGELYVTGISGALLRIDVAPD